MSGHSKWSTIKRKKGAQDAQRSKLWGKLLRYVEVAAREGGGNVEGNATLASAVQKAKENSVPRRPQPLRRSRLHRSSNRRPSTRE